VAKLPVYQSRVSASGGGGGVSLASADTSIGSALQNLGGQLGQIAALNVRKEDDIHERDRKRAEGDDMLRLTSAGMNYQDELQRHLQEAIATMPEDGSGVADSVRRKAAELQSKYVSDGGFGANTFHNPVRASLEFQTRANSVLDQAANVEFKAKLKFRERVATDATNSAAASVGLDPKRFDTELSNLGTKATEWGFQGRTHELFMRESRKKLEAASVANAIGRDPEAFLKASAGFAVSGPAPDQPAHIKSAIDAANKYGGDPKTQLAVAYIESRLNPSHGNPIGRDGKAMSSALGMYQITDSSGVLPDRAARLNHEQAADAWAKHSADNRQRITAAGHSLTPGKEYMFWNVGAGVGGALLRADPNETMGSVLNRVYGNRKLNGELWSDVVGRNNPSLYSPNMTVAQVLSSYENKVNNAIRVVDAKVLSGGDINSTNQARAAFALVVGHDVKELTPVELADYTAKAQTLAKSRAKETNQAEIAQALLSGARISDPHDPVQKEALNEHFKRTNVVQGISSGDPETFTQLRSVVSTTNILPKVASNQLNDAITNEKGGDHPSRLNAFAFYSDLKAQNPVAYRASDVPEHVAKKVDDYRALVTTGGFQNDPIGALKRVDLMSTPEYIKTNRALADDIKTEVNALKFGSLKMANEGIFKLDPGTFGGDDKSLHAVIESQYREHYRVERASNRSAEDARIAAEAKVSETWGLTQATGETGLFSRGKVMLLPPEKVYPGIGVSEPHKWVAEQARHEIGRAFPSDGSRGKYDPETGAWSGGLGTQRAVDFRLVGDQQSLDDHAAKRDVSYVLQYRDPVDGKVVTVPYRFSPNYNVAKAKYEEEFRASHERARSAAENTPPIIAP
jgi:hypothetical protein